jgi:hypothetical protein
MADEPDLSVTTITGRARGGHARAEKLTAGERSSIARRAAITRWGGSMPKAEYKGVLKIGDIQLPCFVLDDGRRVISGRGITSAIGMKGRGQGTARIAALLKQKGSQNNDLTLAIENPIVFESGAPLPTQGYEAPVLVEICESVLDARDAGTLKTEQEQRYGAACYILTKAFAKVGIVALVDEATGYQEIRDRNALQQILDHYIGKELAKWARTFPDEFYREVFRLKGWTFNPGSNKRPMMMAKLTADLIYSRLAPGVLEELRKLSPKDEKGRRKNKLFQWLSPDFGHPVLKNHISGVIYLARANEDWDVFNRALDRAAPPLGKTLLLPLPDDPVDLPAEINPSTTAPSRPSAQ